MLVNLTLLPLLCVMVACVPQVQRLDPNAPPPSMWQWPPSLFHVGHRHAVRRPVAEKRKPAAELPVLYEVPESTEMPEPVTSFVEVPVKDLLGKGREAATQALGPPDTIRVAGDWSRLIYNGSGCRVTLHYYFSNKDWRWRLLQADGARKCRIKKVN